MFDRLESFGFVRGIDQQKRQVTTVVSTDAIARDGFIIDQSGWEFQNYDRNPVVLWVHDDSQLPIAKAVGRDFGPGELIQTHEFAQHDQAERVFQAVVGGFVNATSVRWLPLKTEMRMIEGKQVLAFVRQELLETSYVPVPADPGAVVMRADGNRLDIKRAVLDFRMSCGVPGCPNDGWAANLDVCSFHLDTIRAGGTLPMPPDESGGGMMAHTNTGTVRTFDERVAAAIEKTLHTGKAAQ